MRGRNKLAPRLLGVTKSSVLRLDENSKEILKTWPLSTVRRWVAAPRVFTLDFGDYQDQYYSVQTNEGEQISKLIGGYIDIILKKKEKKERTPEEGDDGEAIESDIVGGKRGMMVHNISGSAAGKHGASGSCLPQPGVLLNSKGECALPVELMYHEIVR